MYIEREIDKFLTDWKEDPARKPLLLRGVRQCGKTSCVRNLGRTFEHYAEVNLERQPRLHGLFNGDLDTDRIIAALEMETNTDIIPGKTLLFIDEIQACPRAVTALRYFYEDHPDLHVVAAGSLLEFALSDPKQPDKINFPVGRVRSVFLYPFSFREFLNGIGKGKLAGYLERLRPGADTNDMHAALLEQYKSFLVVGGMPEAVATYARTGSYRACQQVHQDVLLNFRDDFGKYDAHIGSDMIRKTFDYAVWHICQQTRSSAAIPGMSAYYFDECVSLLRKAGLVFPVSASACDTIPLGSGSKEANRKLLFFDTGIYLTECGLDAAEILAAEAFDSMNKGSVVEMATGLELVKNADPTAEAQLFYWYRSGANAEVDYVLQRGQRPVPVEVKASGKGSMQSMRVFLEQIPQAAFGVRVSLEDFAAYDRIRVCPVYAVSKLARGDEAFFDV